MSWKLLKVGFLLTPLAWLGLLAGIINLVPLRAEYSRLWWEHHKMQTQNPPSSAAGDSLADIFEYMSTARGDYTDALEAVFLLGVLPAFAVYFTVALRKVLQ